MSEAQETITQPHNTPSGRRLVSTPTDLADRDIEMENELSQLQAPQEENPNMQKKSLTFRDRLKFFWEQIDFSAIQKDFFDYEPKYLAEELVLDHLKEVRQRMRVISSSAFSVAFAGLMWYNRYHFTPTHKIVSFGLFWYLSWKLADLELTPYAIKIINQ